MSFENEILRSSPGSITFNCDSGIEIGRIQITRVQKFKCPLKTVNITNTDTWNYVDGIFEADDPGRYIVDYVPI